MGEDLKSALLAGDGSDSETRLVDTHAGKVTVRALTRSEVMHLNKGRELGKIDIAQFECKMVALALVEPQVTEDEVHAWQERERAGGALADITDVIAEMSGLSQGAQKSRVSRARKRARA